MTIQECWNGCTLEVPDFSGEGKQVTIKCLECVILVILQNTIRLAGIVAFLFLIAGGKPLPDRQCLYENQRHYCKDKSECEGLSGSLLIPFPLFIFFLILFPLLLLFLFFNTEMPLFKNISKTIIMSI